jgi:hypothetical protein
MNKIYPVFLICAIIICGCGSLSQTRSTAQLVTSNYAGQWQPPNGEGSVNLGLDSSKEPKRRQKGSVSLQFNTDLSFSGTIAVDILNFSDDTFIKKETFNFSGKCTEQQDARTRYFSGTIKSGSNSYDVMGSINSSHAKDMSFYYEYTDNEKLEWGGYFSVGKR